MALPMGLVMSVYATCALACFVATRRYVRGHQAR